MENLENLKKLLQEFREKTRRQAIKLIAERSQKITATSSKFGGTPYLPKDFAYPICPKGNALKLLAQLNFEELPHLENFPKSGILQFFVLPDEVQGVQEWPAASTAQNTYRVVYHKKILPASEIMTEFPEIKWIEENAEEFFPFEGEFLIKGELVDVFMNSSTVEFKEQFKEFYKEHEILSHFTYFFNTYTEEDWNDWKEKEKSMSKEEYKAFDRKNREMDNLMDEIFSIEEWHLIGGFPYFTQQDTRQEENLRKYDTLLFQMASNDDGDEDYIMWGDAGVANFFITQADLENLNFCDVLYAWDCY